MQLHTTCHCPFRVKRCEEGNLSFLFPLCFAKISLFSFSSVALKTFSSKNINLNRLKYKQRCLFEGRKSTIYNISSHFRPHARFQVAYTTTYTVQFTHLIPIRHLNLKAGDPTRSLHDLTFHCRCHYLLIGVLGLSLC